MFCILMRYFDKMSNADMCTLIQCHFKFPNVTTDTALYYSINYLSLFGSEISVKNIIIVSVYSVPTTLQYVQYLYLTIVLHSNTHTHTYTSTPCTTCTYMYIVYTVYIYPYVKNGLLASFSPTHPISWSASTEHTPEHAS